MTGQGNQANWRWETVTAWDVPTGPAKYRAEYRRPWTRAEAQRLVLGIRAWDRGEPAPPAAAESPGPACDARAIDMALRLRGLCLEYETQAKDLADQIQKAVGDLGEKALAALACFALNYHKNTGRWPSPAVYRAARKHLEKLAGHGTKTEPPDNKREIPH